ncbi:hypothetical protein [Streptomyces sp. NPDC052036]|uniref:hypothetical protein n=1 Tax=unclassified Streptomyces TaxID=2593676 RepID=UPI0034482B05
MDASSLRPEDASCLDEFAAVLRDLRALADRPSYRKLQDATARLGGTLPGTQLHRVPLTRSTLGDVLAGRTFPRKAFLLTYVEACGVDIAADRRWERAWSALALRQKSLEQRDTDPRPETAGPDPAPHGDSAPAPEKDDGTDPSPLTERMLQLARSDARLMARVVERLEHEEIIDIATLAGSNPVVATLFHEMAPTAAGAALSNAPADITTRLLSHLPPERAAHLLTALTSHAAGRILSRLTTPTGWTSRAGQRLWEQVAVMVGAQTLAYAAQAHPDVPPAAELRDSGPQEHTVDLVLCILLRDASLVPAVRESALSFARDLMDTMREKGKPAQDLMVRLIMPPAEADGPMRYTRFLSFPLDESSLMDAFAKVVPFTGDPVSGALGILGEALQSDWSTRRGKYTRHITLVYSDAPEEQLASETPELTPAQAETETQLHKTWSLGAGRDQYWRRNKRLALMTPHSQPWVRISEYWDLTIHFGSRAGEGIQPFEREEVLQILANTY